MSGYAGGGSITINTTPISGGTDGDILYNNGGTVGGFQLYDDTGAGNGAFALRKTMSGSNSTSNFLRITGTTPTVLSDIADAVALSITGAGSSSQQIRALDSILLAGYTGSSLTASVYGQNLSVGTGNSLVSSFAFNGGVVGLALGGGSLAVGTYGGIFTATPTLGIGAVGVANVGTTAVGSLGFASGGTTRVGGYFGLNTTIPTFANAALMADNAAVAVDIFVARDNGTAVFSIVDGGTIKTGTSLLSQMFSGSKTNITEAAPQAICRVTSATGDCFGATVFYTISDGTAGTDLIARSGNIVIQGVNKGGTVTGAILSTRDQETEDGSSPALSGGALTLTYTWTLVAGANTLDLSLNAASNAGTNTLDIAYTVILTGNTTTISLSAQ